MNHERIALLQAGTLTRKKSSTIINSLVMPPVVMRQGGVRVLDII